MSLSFVGRGQFRINDLEVRVHADLTTDVSGGVYSWGGKLRNPEPALLNTAGQGGTLTLPDCEPAEVHVVRTDLSLAHGGILLRITGAGRAPYEQDGDIVTRRGAEGETIHEVADQL